MAIVGVLRIRKEQMTALAVLVRPALARDISEYLGRWYPDTRSIASRDAFACEQVDLAFEAGLSSTRGVALYVTVGWLYGAERACGLFRAFQAILGSGHDEAEIVGALEQLILEHPLLGS